MTATVTAAMIATKVALSFCCWFSVSTRLLEGSEPSGSSSGTGVPKRELVADSLIRRELVATSRELDVVVVTVAVVVVTTVVGSGHRTEAAGTQPNPFARAWHLNGPLPGVAGTQMSPHALPRHGQTVFTQLLGKVVCAY